MTKPRDKLRIVAMKLTEDEYELLAKVARENRRQPGPQAAVIVMQYLQRWAAQQH